MNKWYNIFAIQNAVFLDSDSSVVHFCWKSLLPSYCWVWCHTHMVRTNYIALQFTFSRWYLPLVIPCSLWVHGLCWRGTCVPWATFLGVAEGLPKWYSLVRWVQWPVSTTSVNPRSDRARKCKLNLCYKVAKQRSIVIHGRHVAHDCIYELFFVTSYSF